MNRKSGTTSLLLLGLAAYGIYMYSKMSKQQKEEIVEKGKKFIDENIPQSLKNIFNKEEEYPGRYTQA